jgi:hypothetical protein
MSKRIILTDIDDTALEFTRPFQNWVRTKGYEFERCIRQMKTGATIDALLGTDRETTDKLIEEFTLSTDDFADLPPEPCAARVLPLMHALGYEFIAITATYPTEENRRRRAANLKKAFGFDFYHVHCTGLHQSKREILQTYEPTFWVEDNFGHAVTGHEVGHTSLLVDRTYTRGLEHEGVRRVKNWHEILQIVDRWMR